MMMALAIHLKTKPNQTKPWHNHHKWEEYKGNKKY